ncbi:hypothetical protein D3C76_1822530 [compost metagenome]
MFSQCAAKQLDAGTNYLLKQLPLTPQGDFTSIQPGHIQKVADQTRQARGLLVQSLRSFQGHRR